MPAGAADALQAAESQGPIVFVAVCFGLFVLARGFMEARAQAVKDKAHAASCKAHESAMAGVYDLMRAQNEQHMQKMEGVLGMVGDTVHKLMVEKSLDTREVATALRESSVVVERAVKIMEKIAPTGSNGAGSKQVM